LCRAFRFNWAVRALFCGRRYLLAGDLRNGGTAGEPAVGNDNLSFVMLPNGKQVANNGMANWSEARRSSRKAKTVLAPRRDRLAMNQV